MHLLSYWTNELTNLRTNAFNSFFPVSKSRKRRRLADGKSYGGGAGRITKALEHKLADSYGVAIRQSSEWAKNLDEGDAVKLIERRCRAAFLHNIKNPNDELQHGLCQTEPYSWYSYQKDKYVPLKQKIDPAKQIKRLDPIFLEILTPMIDTLTNPILLRRCLRGATQNANESINSVVWSILPKSKYHGYRSIRGAAAISLIFFNRGRSGLAEFFDQVGIPVTDELLGVLLGKDYKRIEKTIILNDMISSNDEKNSNDSKCRAKRRSAEQSDVVLSEATSFHASYPEEIIALEFKSNISSGTASSHDPLRRVIHEAFLNVNRKDGSAVRNYSSAQRAIERKRKTEDLPLPRPTSFNDILIPGELNVTNGGDQFVLYDNESPNHRMIILSSDDDLDCGRSLPLVYCSIAGNSQAIYDEMFDVILKNVYPHPKSITIDFEKAVKNATLGLQQLFKENNDVRHLLKNFRSSALIPEQSVIAGLGNCKLIRQTPSTTLSITMKTIILVDQFAIIDTVLLVIRIPRGIFMFALINNYQERTIQVSVGTESF
ncbi:unnamed protein product, partial [Rotaria socialis]